MDRLDPDKLSVEFRPGVTPEAPMIGRKYTLTHSDETGELYLTIGLDYAVDQINWMRDEVLAEWVLHEETPFLQAYVNVDGSNGSFVSEIRDKIFRRELPLALEAIRYGDRYFFEAHPQLDQAPIWIYFGSQDPNYNSFENWGTPADYA
ncbi:MAG: hypothetical protein K0Q48_1878 [Bacillota bacterium]|jgi:hypothetical protein|nr:hypothetical protein [Bacillota bacterium]